MASPSIQYQAALKARRAGTASELGADADWPTTKPDFYADSRILSEGALREFEALKSTHGPYGLVDRMGNPITSLDSARSPWLTLTGALKSTGRVVVERAEVPISICPYHEVLATKIGGTAIPLAPLDNNVHGLDTLRNTVEPGAVLAPTLITSLVRRIPAIQQLHRDNTDIEAFARNSVSLLREPLSHPQQYAAAFVFSLATLQNLFSPKFLSDDIALDYTKIQSAPNGENRLAWAKPTEEFTLLWPVDVPNRVQGSVRERITGDHVTRYPIGTKLIDIAVDEPTLGCPGNQLAAAMWQRVIDVAIAEELWSSPA